MISEIKLSNRLIIDRTCWKIIKKKIKILATGQVSELSPTSSVGIMIIIRMVKLKINWNILRSVYTNDVSFVLLVLQKKFCIQRRLLILK